MTAAPRWCQTCGGKPVARKTLRYCFDCLPGGPHLPPPCSTCGSRTDYWTAGKCRWCYRGTAAQLSGSCPDCHAWGTTRNNAWVCRACLGWRRKNPTIGDCAVCGQHRHLGRGPYCRLCWRTASTDHFAHRRDGSTYLFLDVEAANRHGQQLFFADLTRLAQHRRPPQPRQPGGGPAARRIQYRQLALFDNKPPSFTARHGIPEPSNHRRAEALDILARELAGQRGWSHSSLKRTRLAIKVLLGQHPGTGPIRASDLESLTSLGIASVVLVRAVLVEAGLLDDDLTPAPERRFLADTAQLPEAMRSELRLWFDIMCQGSRTPPRRKPRTETTTRLHATHALPPIGHWAAAGHRSLREIGRDDVLAVLPPGGDARTLTGAALRSIFVVLHGRRLVFRDPTTGIRLARIEPGQPIPLPAAMIKDALHSDNPACAALTALIAFYALGPQRLRSLRLTDIRDRRLHVNQRALTMPPIVHDKISAYLDHRARRWPSSLNPHLFINQSTAGHTTPVGPAWIWRTLPFGARGLREDRILDEAHATRGDVRRLCDLFDMSVATALRYVDALEHPDLASAE